MESEVSEHQFWDELQEIVSAPCSSEDLIDNALRSYLSLATKYKDEYLQSELEVSRCSYKLLSSSLFAEHADYVRRQMVYGLLQEDDPDTLAVIASFLLFDGRRNEIVLRTMNEEGSFARLLELLQAQSRKIGYDGAGLHRLLMDLLYEMSRVQRVRIEDLVLVDDDFIKSLFDIIEDLSYDVNDPYHYPVIRVLLVLNEQFMISAHDPVDERTSSNALTNKVIKILSMHGNLYKTFGENIILLINREAETSLQLLTLKLLYLIFTTPRTYEYFYTNDLHVLVDILIRNLLDLPEEASALRHTYLRVLYPLLAHTQLATPPHYKRDELKHTLNILVRGQLADSDPDHEKPIMHFDAVDETTRRLVLRCATVDWMRDQPAHPVDTTIPEDEELPGHHPDCDLPPATTTISHSSSPSTGDSSPDTVSPTRLDDDEHKTPKPRHPRRSKPNNPAERLGMHLERASSSSLSVQEVAAQHEKPGVLTPSLTDHIHHHRPASPTKPKPKIKPLPPKARRWRGRRTTHPDDDYPPDKIIVSEAPTPSGSPLTPAPSTPDLPPHHHGHPISIPVAIAADEAIDRRNSTTTSGLAPPPVPAARRSTSNPPAVPPPRRSTHPAVQPHHLSSHCTPLHSPSRGSGLSLGLGPGPGPGTGLGTGTSANKPSQPPELPRARRTGRSRHLSTGEDKERDRIGSSRSPANGDENGNGSGNGSGNMNGDGNEGTVSVEEAVQNVSLH